MVLCLGAPAGSTGSGSCFKASQETGPRLKVSSDRLGEDYFEGAYQVQISVLRDCHPGQSVSVLITTFKLDLSHL